MESAYKNPLAGNLAVDLESLISISKTEYDFQEDLDVPDGCDESIFIPGIGPDCKHYYFLIDFKARRISCWDVDLSQVKDDLKSKLSLSEIDSIPWNQKSIDKFLEVIFFSHSADYYENTIYVSFIEGNFILALDVTSSSYELIYEKEDNGMMIYSSTNMIRDGYMYYTKWPIAQTFIHEKDRNQLVDLEIGRYNLKSKVFESFDSIKGPDDIHSTMVTPDGENLILVEMSQDPIIKPPLDSEMASLSREQRLEIFDSRLRNSSLITYNIASKNAHSIELPDGPAHIEFDNNDPSVFYISSHNLSTNNDTLFCFGNSKIDKFRITDGESRKIEHYQDKDFLRAPSHKLFSFEDRRLMVVPVYPNQAHIIDTSDMSIYKKIILRKVNNQIDFSDGPFIYPKVNLDKTPYTIHPVNYSSILYLSSVWNVTVYDFETGAAPAIIRYNKNKPVIAMGHASKFSL